MSNSKFLTATDVILYTIYNPLEYVQILDTYYSDHSIIHLDNSYFMISDNEKIKLIELCIINPKYKISHKIGNWDKFYYL